MSTISFTIPGALPGLNEIIAANRVSSKSSRKRFFAYTGVKHDVENKIKLCAMPQGRSRSLEPLRSFDAYFSWVEKDARRDPDNVAAGVKFIFDALVGCGMIAGDRAANVLSITHKFAVSRDEPRVEVLLVDA